MARNLGGGRPGQGRVPPFARDAVAALHQALVDHHSAAAAGAYDGGEHHPGVRGGAVDRLRERQAVGVVGQPDLPRQRRLQVLPEPAAVQPGGVGVANHPGARGHRPWRADADTIAGSGLGLGLLDEVSDGAERRVIAAGIGRPDPANEAPARIQRRRLDLGASEINADPVHRRRIDPSTVRRNDLEASPQAKCNLTILVCCVPVETGPGAQAHGEPAAQPG